MPPHLPTWLYPSQCACIIISPLCNRSLIPSDEYTATHFFCSTKRSNTAVISFGSSEQKLEPSARCAILTTSSGDLNTATFPQISSEGLKNSIIEEPSPEYESALYANPAEPICQGVEYS